jgi:hypothetical protein
MPTGDLALNILDLDGRPPADSLLIRLQNDSGAWQARFPHGQDRLFVVSGVPCRPGLGTRYEVSIESDCYLRFAFFQTVREGAQSQPAVDPVRLVADPRRVSGVIAPLYHELPPHLREMLDLARMAAPRPEDRPLAGLAGERLYAALSDLQRACLLNVCAKAMHDSAGGCLQWLGALRVLRQDRFYCEVDPALPSWLAESDRFRSVNGSLHQPLPGFQRARSYKSRDRHANLQVTLFQHGETGQWAADVDIDEATGVRHGFEVIRNSITGKRTNPFLIRELLLLSGDGTEPPRPLYSFNLRKA